MKKFLLTICLLMALVLLTVPAMAADEDVAITLTPSSSTVYPGEELVLTVSVSATEEYTSIGYKLDFDSNVFEFVKYTTEDATVTGASSNGILGKSILVNFNNAGKHSGVLGKVTLKVKEVSPSSQTVGGTVSCKNVNAALTGASVSAEISIGCDHSYGAWAKLDDESHQRVCTKCNAPEVKKHSWNKGVEIDDATCTAPGKIKYTCTVDECGAEKIEDTEPLKHIWVNACDTDCNRPGCTETREISHDYGADWSADKIEHWHECSVCHDRTDVGVHIPGPEATEDAPQTCTECGFVLAQAEMHIHQMGTEWFNDGEYHWHRCEKKNPSCYYAGEKLPHDYDNDCDVSCNTCGYIRVAVHSYNLEWRAGSEGHWHICGSCGAKSEVYPHTPGEPATEDAPQICLDCEYWIKWPLNHIHTFGENWFSNEESHWKNCTDCDEKDALAPHSWDEGVTTEQGTVKKTCTVCGKEKVEGELPPATTPTTPTQGSSTPGGQSNSAHPQSGGFPWEIAGIAAVVLLIVGIMLLVIEFIRSRKTHSKGKYSKKK